MEDLRDEESRDRVLPAFQGAEVAFATAMLEAATSPEVDLVPIDLGTDPSALGEVIDDPGFVAAIIAPDVRGGAPRQELTAAGLAVVDLSPFGGPATTDVGAWRRLVPPVRIQVAVLAAHVDAAPGARTGVCLLKDAATAVGLLRPTARALKSDVVLSATVPPGETGGLVRRGGCRLVVWDGDGSSAATVVLELAAAGLGRVTLLGGERLRDAGFLGSASNAAEGAVSVCGCADVSTSTALSAQRFIQDYQSEYGLPPGPYAVEAWDAAHVVLRAIRGSEPTREDVRDQVDRAMSFEGLVAVYAFGDDGDLASPVAFVRLSRVVGGRWVPLPSAA